MAIVEIGSWIGSLIAACCFCFAIWYPHVAWAFIVRLTRCVSYAILRPRIAWAFMVRLARTGTEALRSTAILRPRTAWAFMVRLARTGAVAIRNDLALGARGVAFMVRLATTGTEALRSDLPMPPWLLWKVAVVALTGLRVMIAALALLVIGGFLCAASEEMTGIAAREFGNGLSRAPLVGLGSLLAGLLFGWLIAVVGNEAVRMREARFARYCLRRARFSPPPDTSDIQQLDEYLQNQEALHGRPCLTFLLGLTALFGGTTDTRAVSIEALGRMGAPAGRVLRGTVQDGQASLELRLAAAEIFASDASPREIRRVLHGYQWWPDDLATRQVRAVIEKHLDHGSA